MDVERTYKGCRPCHVLPSEEFPDRFPAPAHHVDTLVKRQESGQDLTTGKMLRGKDAQEWLGAWIGLEHNDIFNFDIIRIVRADNNYVAFIRKLDGNVVTLKRTTKGRKTTECKIVSILPPKPREKSRGQGQGVSKSSP